MRKQQYIATVACLVAGVIGFVSVYATDKGKEMCIRDRCVPVMIMRSLNREKKQKFWQSVVSNL